jgi:hypothetical protein
MCDDFVDLEWFFSSLQFPKFLKYLICLSPKHVRGILPLIDLRNYHHCSYTYFFLLIKINIALKDHVVFYTSVAFTSAQFSV